MCSIAHDTSDETELDCVYSIQKIANQISFLIHAKELKVFVTCKKEETLNPKPQVTLQV